VWQTHCHHGAYLLQAWQTRIHHLTVAGGHALGKHAKSIHPQKPPSGLMGTQSLVAHRLDSCASIRKCHGDA